MTEREKLPLQERADDTGCAWERCRRMLCAAVMAVIVITIVAVSLHKLQFCTNALIGNDGYFHIKYSYLMSHGHGLIRKLPWLHYTIHRDYYRDHHFLQHLLYLPFTFGELRLGGKVAAWFYGVLAMAVFYCVCARKGKWLAAILTLILLGASTRFLTRLIMPRVPSMFMLMLLLATHAIITRRSRWLAGIMFAFVWLYDGFALVIVVMLCFFIAELITERRCNWRMLVWGFGGIAAGIIINPYFPHNIGSYLFNLQRTATSAQLIERTGWEWKPFDAWFLLTTTKGIWIVLGIGILLAVLSRKPSRECIALLLATIFATVLAMKARRYQDTWPPLVLLFMAYTWAGFWDEQKEKHPRAGPRWQTITTVLLASVIAFTPFVLRAQLEKTRDEKPFEYYQGAAEYIRRTAPPATIVFNTDWDDFPFLFFFNSESYYILGLDQLYMIHYDKEMFELWRSISKGEVADPSGAIYENFNSTYAVVEKKSRKAFMLRAALDKNMRRVYNDKYCAVYRIVPE